MTDQALLVDDLSCNHADGYLRCDLTSMPQNATVLMLRSDSEQTLLHSLPSKLRPPKPPESVYRLHDRQSTMPQAVRWSAWHQQSLIQ